MGFFLCLSTVMIMTAIVRSSWISDSRGINTIWQGLWHILECCFALLMASITAFRSIFVTQRMRERDQKRWAPPASSWIQGGAEWRRSSNKEADDAWEEKGEGKGYQRLPSVLPRATFAKLRMMHIRGQHQLMDEEMEFPRTLKSATTYSHRDTGNETDSFERQK